MHAPFSTARRLALFGVGFALIGCEGGQTGSEWNKGPIDNDPPCKLFETELQSDELSPLGFTLTDVVASISGPRSSTLLWRSLAPDLDVTPAGSSSLEVELEPDLLSGHFVHYTLKGAGVPASTICPPDHVEFEAKLAIDTADGGLSERTSVLVNATASTNATAVGLLPWDALHGTFRAEAREGFVALEPNLVFEIDALSTRGTLTGGLEQSNRPPPGARTVQYACWPAESCGND